MGVWGPRLFECGDIAHVNEALAHICINMQIHILCHTPGAGHVVACEIDIEWFHLVYGSIPGNRNHGFWPSQPVSKQYFEACIEFRYSSLLIYLGVHPNSSLQFLFASFYFPGCYCSTVIRTHEVVDWWTHWHTLCLTCTLTHKQLHARAQTYRVYTHTHTHALISIFAQVCTANTKIFFRVFGGLSLKMWRQRWELEFKLQRPSIKGTRLLLL